MSEPEEHWVSLHESEYYFISDHGRLWSEFRGGCYLAITLRPDGYLGFRAPPRLRGMCSELIHVEVARGFIPNPNNLPMVNHKDGNRANANATNLEWITASGNARDGATRNPEAHAHRRRPVCQFDLETGEVLQRFRGVQEAARLIGVGVGCISGVLTGRVGSYKSKGWRYDEATPDPKRAQINLIVEPDETWLPIPGFPDYLVDTWGQMLKLETLSASN